MTEGWAASIQLAAKAMEANRFDAGGSGKTIPIQITPFSDYKAGQIGYSMSVNDPYLLLEKEDE
jgi:hypothetical protein